MVLPAVRSVAIANASKLTWKSDNVPFLGTEKANCPRRTSICITDKMLEIGLELPNPITVGNKAVVIGRLGIITFASGILPNLAATGLTATVIGFGSSTPVGGLADLLHVDLAYGQFAFPISANGTLSKFQVSFDALAVLALTILPGSVTFTFTVYKSSCANAKVTTPSYNATTLSVPLTLTVPAGLSNLLFSEFNGCASSGAATLAVSAGDRIAVQVSSSALVNLNTLLLTTIVALNASMLYTPS